MAGSSPLSGLANRLKNPAGLPEDKDQDEQSDEQDEEEQDHAEDQNETPVDPQLGLPGFHPLQNVFRKAVVEAELGGAVP